MWRKQYVVYPLNSYYFASIYVSHAEMHNHWNYQKELLYQTQQNEPFVYCVNQKKEAPNLISQG